MDIDQIRRVNLQTLAEEHGGIGKLADLLEKDQSQVSQWINASINSGTGKPRGIRSSTCRYIEEKCNKSIGWLDKDHSSPEQNEASTLIWPFENISYEKVKNLKLRDLIRLEAGIELAAKDLGLDIVETSNPAKSEVA